HLGHRHADRFREAADRNRQLNDDISLSRGRGVGAHAFHANAGAPQRQTGVFVGRLSLLSDGGAALARQLPRLAAAERSGQVVVSLDRLAATRTIASTGGGRLKWVDRSAAARRRLAARFAGLVGFGLALGFMLAQVFLQRLRA